MDTLPICEVPMPSSQLVEQYLVGTEGEQLKFTIHENLKVNKIISDNLGGDCWALTNTTCGGNKTEFLFNNYREEFLTIKEIIMNCVIRDKIRENPHSNLLIQLYRFNRSAEINIYMCKEHPYKIRIYYNSDNKVFYIDVFMSEACKLEYYGDN